MDYTNIRQVREIVSFADATHPEEVVNSYLARGWVLLAIQQLAIKQGDVAGNPPCLNVVYILGHTETNADTNSDTYAEQLLAEPANGPETYVAAGAQFVPGAFLWG